MKRIFHLFCKTTEVTFDTAGDSVELLFKRNNWYIVGRTLTIEDIEDWT